MPILKRYDKCHIHRINVFGGCDIFTIKDVKVFEDLKDLKDLK